MKDSVTTKLPTHQRFEFEVHLEHVGMDFSMGQVTDAVRVALKTVSNLSDKVRVACYKIEVE